MASPNVIEFTQDNWSEHIGSGSVVVADFWAPWCGPCRAIAPVIDRVADQFAGKAKIGKVNIDEYADMAVKYDIQTIPRILIFKGSETPVYAHAGPISDAELTKLINANM